jgi:hypothetical protein
MTDYNFGIYSHQNEIHQLCYSLKGRVEKLEKTQLPEVQLPDEVKTLPAEVKELEKKITSLEKRLETLNSNITGVIVILKTKFASDVTTKQRLDQMQQ